MVRVRNCYAKGEWQGFVVRYEKISTFIFYYNYRLIYSKWAMLVFQHTTYTIRAVTTFITPSIAALLIQTYHIYTNLYLRIHENLFI